jgi:predicted metal-dependent phosphoesterase TrpH
MDKTVPCYDLHSHSTASDGTLSPTALVERACRQGVDVLALTDHDVLDGLAEAGRAAQRRGLRLIPGVEISVSWGGRVIHVVGLGIDAAHAGLRRGLEDLRQQRQRRAEQIGQRLERLGISGAHAGARELSGGQIVTRSHFAHYLVNQGIVSNFQAAFRRYLRQGRPAHVACDWTSLECALTWIHDAGGQAVIAHPARYGMSGLKLRTLLSEFSAAGGSALEVVSSSHNPVETLKMAELARCYGLRASVGSDFHSPDQGWAELGRVAPLPAGCTPVWHDWPQYKAKKPEHRSVASV